MPSFIGLRSRPATSASNNHRRHSSILDVNSPGHEDNPERGHRSVGSLQRLSLSLSHPGETSFGGLFTQEPDDVFSRPQPTEEQRPASPSTPKAHTSLARLGKAPASEDDGMLKISEERPARQERFSLLKFRHASDSQLSTMYKESAESPPEPVPTPKIITTAPTSQQLDEPVKKKKKTVFGRSLSPFRKSTIIHEQDGESAGSAGKRPPLEGTFSTPNLGKTQKIQFDEYVNRDNHRVFAGPPAYGDESSSALAIPISRLSESGGSEGSSGDHKVYARTTTTISTTTTFFRLKKKKKDKGHLFPLPERFPRPSSERTSMSITGEGSRRSMSPGRRSTQAVRFENEDGESLSPVPSPTHSLSALTNAPLGSPGPAVVRKHSVLSAHSGASTPSLVPPRIGARGRSSTMGSLGRSSDRDGDGTPQLPPSGRTSTSTNGRRSFGDLLMFSHRLRQNSAPPRHGSGNSPSTPGSKSNSMQINRESEPEIAYPTREESDTPATYLEKLEAAVQRGSLATILCKNSDEFAKTCLRKYMRGFSYFGESIDMSIRKMLMEVELPKETQQIDRLLAGFADRYYECNPGIFTNVDEASIIAFSILLLHSDNHNKNNKRKMQKSDYVKNTQHGRVNVSGDILECFYDNICYTPFIHFEDEIAVNSHRLAAPKAKKSLIRSKSFESLHGQVDPYTLILDNKLDSLRPSLKDVIDTEDTYSSTGTLKTANSNDHHRSFVNSAVLQIVSARSRPDAFATQATITNPLEAQAGLVSIKVAKVGLLWRKDAKKKKAKRPWQEWGAILTDSKLYFFKDIGWVKKLMGQYENQSKHVGKASPLIFKPPLTSFEPDALMAMDDAVALMDSSYKKHKNAFTFIKHGGFEEVFLANSETEMNDWISKLNYAATFRTAGVRMRGLLGTTYEGKHLLRKDSEISTSSNDAGTGEQNTTNQSEADSQLAWEIMFYRRQLVNEKISSFDDKLAVAQKELEQLLRNARHLLILLPIQSRTREALVLAAGRMSAKLKWTRVEIWRSKTHRDILIKDLEADAAVSFPPPAKDPVTSPPKSAPKKSSQQVNGHGDADANNLALTPTLTAAASIRRPSQTVLEQIKTTDDGPEEQLGRRASLGKILTTSPKATARPILDESSPKPDPFSDSPKLQHKSSIISSQRSHQDHEPSAGQPNNGQDREDPMLREAGLAGVEGDVSRDKLLGSESEKDRIGAASPTGADGSTPKEHRTSVRRSLHRTLREGHHVMHTPSHHRRRGKESGSSAAVTEDGRILTGSDGQELKRGAGSFILHGKKASVITMSPEWHHMSSEERMKSRPVLTEEEKETLDDARLAPETPIDGGVDDTISQITSGTTPLASPDREAFHSARSSRRPSATSFVTQSETG